MLPVVLVARVGGHPVVGAGLRGARALRRCVFAVVGDLVLVLGRAPGAILFPYTTLFRSLPADLPAGVGAEQAGDLGLVLEGLTDRARGGVLAGFDRQLGRAHL